MARRQNVRDRIGMAVYEKKKLNKKLVTMQKSFQEVKHSPDHHGCGDVLYPDAPYRSLELPLKSSRLQVHGCFLDGSAICNKMNAQYVPVGRGLGLYSLFLDMKNTLRVFRVLFFTLSTLGVAYQK